MINRQTLLSDLQKLLQRLEADLLERSESAEVPEVGRTLRAEYDRAKSAERTAQNYEDWRTDAITQAAVAWVLSCVFVRFLEDNRLIDPPIIAGPTDSTKRVTQFSAVHDRPIKVSKIENRLERARDEHELYFKTNPKLTNREYLLAVFDQLAKLPGTKDVYGEHNPIRELPNWLSGDAAGELLRFFQKIDANTGSLVHDFTDSSWDTRFLGDLYQDLSEAARKKYALLQTPEFVEEFILDRTLNPALEEFGLDAPPILDKDGKPRTDIGFRMIDPACGSGHFLLGAFPRILDRWQRKEPGTNVRELVQRTLNTIYGVDINPYAVAIARFRLLLAALRACGIQRLDKNVPGFKLNLVCGDSLMHGSPGGDQELLFFHELAHVYQSEDLSELRRVLAPCRYHAVVANPPYITVKDKALNQAYRERYPEVCHMKYSLSVPFIQRLNDLTVPNGFTWQITANSFMKREFGKKLIESYVPLWDINYVIDTSLAYIPGHGTPTVILFGRSRKPVASTIRTAMGIAGEPTTPHDPAKGLYWTAVVDQIDQPGSQSRFISVNDSLRESFHKHPWNIGGGGAAELKEQLSYAAEQELGMLTTSIGPPSFTGIDEMFLGPSAAFLRAGVTPKLVRPLCIGEQVRYWSIERGESALVPYDSGQELITFDETSKWAHRLWPYRACSEGMVSFARQTRKDLGEIWWSWYRWIGDRYRTHLSIVFGEVTTHNHFVLDRGGKVFKQTAPVIKLPSVATEDDHLVLLGLLNSSTACFWMKQVCFPKGTTTGTSARKRDVPRPTVMLSTLQRSKNFQYQKCLLQIEKY